jgi:uncharacterized protein YhdP
MLTQLQRRWPLRTLGRIVLGVFAVLTALVATGLLLIRFWLWPSVPQWQDDFLASTRAILAQRGLSLEVGGVTADWERWYRPRLTVETLALRDAQGQALAQIERVQATIGLSTFASVWRMTPVFSEIRIQGPRLVATRDSSGTLAIAGFQIGSEKEFEQAPKDASLSEWLLRQGRIQINNGSLVWSDAVKGKSTEVRELSIALRNFGYRHSWSVRGQASETIGDAFLAEGNIRGSLFGSAPTFKDWSGDVFVQFDRVDLSELLGFVQLPESTPLKINSGLGSFKAWANLSNKALKDLTVDVDLAKASLQWGQARRPLTLEQLSGRVETVLSGNRQLIKIVDLSLRSEQLSEPVRISAAELSLEQGTERGESRIRAASKMVDLAAARWLIGHLPLAQSIKDRVSSLQPQGYLRDVELSWVESAERLLSASLSAGFESLALRAGPQRPSFSGLSGRINATESSGSISINSNNASLVIPRVFEEPRITLERLSAELAWNVGPSAVDGGFTPLKVTVSGFSASNSDVALEAFGDYELLNEGPGTVDIKGRVVRASPSQVYRYVPLVAGEQTRKWLREALKESSPYRANFELSGPLEKFPFADGKSGKFLVKAQVEDGRLQPAPGWPMLTGIKADVTFDRTRFELLAQQSRFASLQSSKIKAQILDMNALQTLLQVQGELKGDLQQFFAAANQSPVKNWLGGITETMSGKGETSLALDLNLNLSDDTLSRYSGDLRLGRGILRPSAKLPSVAIGSGSIEFNELGLAALTIQGEALGGPLKATRQAVPGAPSHSRLVLEGRATGRGLEQWARQAFDANWRGQLSGSTPFSAAIDIGGASTQAFVTSSLRGLASKLAAPLIKPESEEWLVEVQYHGANGEIHLDLDAPKAKGRLRWTPEDKTDSLLRAQFDRVWLDSGSQSDAQALAQKDNAALAHHWPRVDLKIDDFRVGARQWGRVEVQAQPAYATRSWDISKLVIANPDAVLTGEGRWATHALDSSVKAPSRTVLDLVMQVKNSGGLLTRTGYPGVVRDTSGKIEGQLSWPGSPLAFSGGRLGGELSLNLERGRFLKAEPGVARLIGVLNLQTLPRRIKLDFSDVFSEGFTYERIRGNLQFFDGEVTTKNLRIVGVQASVLLEGSASIRNETQNLRVLVLPEVNAGLASLGYAALVNPAIGLGAFLAQYVLRDPVRKLLAYEYQLTGSWDDPVVTSVARESRVDIPEMSPSTK